MTGNQLLDLILPLITEAAFQEVSIRWRLLLIVIGHHYQPSRKDNPDYAEKRPAGDDEYQGDDAGRALWPGSTLGATRMNDLAVLRTQMNNGHERTRGHGLI
jgi:hypothetical protein